MLTKVKLKTPPGQVHPRSHLRAVPQSGQRLVISNEGPKLDSILYAASCTTPCTQGSIVFHPQHKYTAQTTSLPSQMTPHSISSLPDSTTPKIEFISTRRKHIIQIISHSPIRHSLSENPGHPYRLRSPRLPSSGTPQQTSPGPTCPPLQSILPSSPPLS